MDITELTPHEIEAKIDSILHRADPEFWAKMLKNKHITIQNCQILPVIHPYTNIKINSGITLHVPYPDQLSSNYTQRLLVTKTATPVYDYMLKVAKLMFSELNLYLCAIIDPDDKENAFNYYWYGATPDNALKIVNDPANALYIYIDPRLQFIDDNTADTIRSL